MSPATLRLVSPNTSPTLSANGWRRHPAVERYLSRLEECLTKARVDKVERRSILLEIDSHVAEALQTGETIDQVLERLGSPPQLAVSYSIALDLDDVSPAADSNRLARLQAITSRLAGTLVQSTLVLLVGTTGVLGATGVVSALVLPTLPPSLLDPTLRFGLPQLVILAASLALLALSWHALRWARVHERIRRIHGTKTFDVHQRSLSVPWPQRQPPNRNNRGSASDHETT